MHNCSNNEIEKKVTRLAYTHTALDLIIINRTETAKQKYDVA
jgi:hypothetical protein